jgi:hypothetical protein
MPRPGGNLKLFVARARTLDARQSNSRRNGQRPYGLARILVAAVGPDSVLENYRTGPWKKEFVLLKMAVGTLKCIETKWVHPKGKVWTSRPRLATGSRERLPHIPGPDQMGWDSVTCTVHSNGVGCFLRNGRSLAMMNPLVRRFVMVAASAATLTMLCSRLPLIAQEPKAPQTETGAKTAKRVYDPARRLPRYFGQIGLSDSQVEEVYKIQGKHMPKITVLEKQIEDLRAQMLRECEGVLKASQKQLLDQHRADAAAAPKARRKSTAKPQP